jgi:hypothetical protein
MAKRVLLSAMIVALLMITVGAGSSLAWYYHARGRVIIPDGDPVVGIGVNFYRCEDGQKLGTVYTDDNGYWDAYFVYCEMCITACVGRFRMKGTTECVSSFIWCSGITWFEDIVLECGGPKQPPCPHQ